ncbi:hypothetical protein BJY01DRAFT_201603 [Aspergillus pseudoustus]|uniref:Uncharacterized protein n=1 Tax=Aspergillus pseudoustus TaxID=1810923 RepID=A0ABR4L398_9EURO
MTGQDCRIGLHGRSKRHSRRSLGRDVASLSLQEGDRKIADGGLNTVTQGRLLIDESKRLWKQSIFWFLSSQHRFLVPPCGSRPGLPQKSETHTKSEPQRSVPGSTTETKEKCRHWQTLPWIRSPKAKHKKHSIPRGILRRWKIEIFLPLAQRSPEKVHALSGVLPRESFEHYTRGPALLRNGIVMSLLLRPLE